MKERLDVLVVSRGLAPVKRKSESDYYGGKCAG